MDYINREALIERPNMNLRACNPGTFSEICYADAIETVINFPAADVEPPRRWIPCSERMPEKEGTYIVVSNRVKPVVTTARFYADNDLHDYKGNILDHISAHFQSNRYVTHWMPLPEPPKEGAID